MIRRTAAVLFFALFLATTGAFAQARPAEDAQAPRGQNLTSPQAQQPIVVTETSARDTREQFRQIMQRYPPDLGRILRLDPTLMRNPAYVGQYPALAQFLAAHPEIPQNPEYYLEFVRYSYDYNEPRDPRSAVIDMWRNMFEAVGAFMIFLVVAGLLTWLIRTFIDYRRWLRVSKVHTEVHNKLMERFSGSAELLNYIQSPAGRRFLEAAPIPLDAGPRALAAPVARILWSVQAGVVVLAAGLGFQFASGRVIDDVGQGLWLIGILGMALGIGLVSSGFISYVLSRRLGLMDPLPPPPGAERIDPTAV